MLAIERPLQRNQLDEEPRQKNIANPDADKYPHPHPHPHPHPRSDWFVAALV